MQFRKKLKEAMKIKIKFNFLDRVLVNFYVIVIQNGNTVKKY